MQEKLSDRRVQKQAEIRVREEEIKVIEDLLHFIDAFESKRSPSMLSRAKDPSSSVLLPTISHSSSHRDQAEMPHLKTTTGKSYSRHTGKRSSIHCLFRTFFGNLSVSEFVRLVIVSFTVGWSDRRSLSPVIPIDLSFVLWYSRRDQSNDGQRRASDRPFDIFSSLA